MQRLLWIPWRWWRRAAQLALLLVFLWLFRRTESTGAEELAGGENLFFRLDPLAAAAAMLGARRLLVAFWPAAAVVLLTMVLGRFFCGWVCPLGTLLDYFHRLFLSGPLALWKMATKAFGWHALSPSEGRGVSGQGVGWHALSPSEGRGVSGQAFGWHALSPSEGRGVSGQAFGWHALSPSEGRGVSGQAFGWHALSPSEGRGVSGQAFGWHALSPSEGRGVSGRGGKGDRRLSPERPDQPSVGARCCARKAPDPFPPSPSPNGRGEFGTA